MRVKEYNSKTVIPSALSVWSKYLYIIQIFSKYFLDTIWIVSNTYKNFVTLSQNLGSEIFLSFKIFVSVIYYTDSIQIYLENIPILSRFFDQMDSTINCVLKSKSALMLLFCAVLPRDKPCVP